MSERRRRTPRKTDDEDSSFCSSDEDLKRPAKAESEDGHSEYESAAESGEEAEKDDVRKDDVSDRVDDDEDRRNPQYIPKRGVFYEHDDRIDSEEESSDSEKSEKAKTANKIPGRRVTRSEAASQWGHDKFAELDQAPKTKDELVSVYGYDIRSEDAAPRARRRRKYGRGPNKYTRNWENEDAYQKMPSRVRGVGVGPRRGGGRGHRETNGEPPEESIPADSRGHPARHGVRGKRGGFRDRAPLNREERGGKRDAPNTSKRRSKESMNETSDAADPEVDRVESIERTLGRTSLNRPIGDNYNSILSSTSSSRQKDKSVEPSSSSKPKRYSQRQRTGNLQTASSPLIKEDCFERGVGSYQEYPNRIQNFPGKNSAVTQYPNSGGFNRSAPSSNGHAHAAAPANAAPPPSYIAPGMVNYGPPPVQYTVPVTVPLAMSLVPQPETFTAMALVPPAPPAAAGPAAILATPHHMAPAELIPLGGPNNSGYAEVRGGVTYFNQAPVMIQPVNKRPKAAIPIVDPSNVDDKEDDRSSSPPRTESKNDTQELVAAT